MYDSIYLGNVNNLFMPFSDDERHEKSKIRKKITKQEQKKYGPLQKLEVRSGANGVRFFC